MIDVIRQFRARTDEIDTYFSHLEDLLVENAQLVFNDGTKKTISVDLAQILRANAFLLLYNLVESSISQAIEQIHLEIVNEGIDYNKINDSVRKEIIKYIKRDISLEIFVSQVRDIMIDIVKFYPTSRKLFSGNIDAKKIREVADRYGFSHITDSSRTRDGSQLRTVKTRRNDLAHGFISFQECGKDYTIQEVVLMKNEVVLYLTEILQNIKSYIDNKEYLI